MAALIGGLLAWVLAAPLTVMLVFGALVSATDPVSVLATFRSLGAPRRLTYVVEGESLFNDGTAIVLFRILLALMLAGQLAVGAAIWEFAWVSAGGILVGLLLGWLISRVVAHLDDYLVETMLTAILAYGSFALAEQLHVSGVLAVVAAGVVAGNVGLAHMSPTTRVGLSSFWDFATFVANSFVFLLIGLAVDLPTLLANLRPIGWAVAAVLLARLVVVYPFSRPFDRMLGPMPLAWRHVLFWGGLRGAIALALALSLPASLGPWQETLRAMAFGVVLFTLLVQGTTIGPLLRRLGLVERPEERDALSLGVAFARREALLAERSALQDLVRRGELSPESYRTLAAEVDRRLQELGNGEVAG
jgi:CPA1 family monovalent cation:H+ antiporter